MLYFNLADAVNAGVLSQASESSSLESGPPLLSLISSPPLTLKCVKQHKLGILSNRLCEPQNLSLFALHASDGVSSTAHHPELHGDQTNMRLLKVHLDECSLEAGL